MSNSATTPGIAVKEIPGRPIVQERKPDPTVMVIFGALGDLTRRKLMPALYNLALDGKLPDRFTIVGVGRDKLPKTEFQALIREGISTFSRRKPIDDRCWDSFAPKLELVSGTFEDPATYQGLAKMLSQAGCDGPPRCNRIFYLATPPDQFGVILERLHGEKLLKKGDSACRVIIEKPFGRDLASAVALNDLVARYLDENQTFRIDHYLGKETVQNILVFRFGNAILEPLWNRKYIDHIQIVASETLGVERRGKFYDSTGVVRDVVQNHLLQILALCAMDPPVDFGADDVRDEKTRLMRSLRPITGPDVATEVVLGQYRGYRQESGVAADSRTPTYVAMKVMIDNWRWQGVPFYLRAGKQLGEAKTEISIHFQTIPLCLFRQEETCQVIAPNVLRLRIQPQEGISLRFVAKVPGDHLSVGNVLMNMDYAEAFNKPISDAYERLLVDCMRGDATLFARRDGIEQAWQFITPILEAWESQSQKEVPQYEPGSAGPKEADALPKRDGRRWE